MPAARTRKKARSQATVVQRALDGIERIGNALPDPAVLFFAIAIPLVPAGLNGDRAFRRRHQ